MDDKHNSNRHFDYDESVDIFSDSSREPRRRSSSQRVPPPPQRNQRPSQRAVQQPPNRNQRPPKRSNSKYDTMEIPISRNQPPKKKKKRSTPGAIFAKVFFSIVLVLLLLFAIGYAVFSNFFSGMNFDDSINKENAFIDESKLIGDSGVRNILLIGGDAREGEKNYRSDTMMLVSIDTNNKKIKMTSFLRDSWVEIPGKGYNKLNAATSYGGIQLLIDTLEYNFRVKIDNYAMVDFAAFKDIVDALGGVNVAVTEKEARYMNRTYPMYKFNIKSGDNVHLNGLEALEYCRIRKLDSDFFRTERQRKVMSAIKAKASDASATQVLNVVNKVLPYIKTDIKKNEMMKLSMLAATKYLKYEIVELHIPADGAWKSESKHGQSVLVFDIDDAKDMVHAFIYEDTKTK